MSRWTCRGSTWRPGRCRLASAIRRRSSPFSAIHLASTSSESGSRGGAVRARLVRELDAVLVEQPAGLRQVGDDRLVRVDQVGVGHAARGRGAVVGDRAGGLAAPDAEEAEVAVHRPLLLVDARLAGARGRAARRGARDRGRSGAVVALARGLLRARRRVERRSSHGRLISHSRARTTIAVAQRATVMPPPALLRPAGRAREEDDAVGVARDLLEGADHLRLRGGPSRS